MDRRPLSSYRPVFPLLLLLFLLGADALGAQESPPAPTHATGFELEERGELTVLRVLEPWPGGAPITYALLPEGAAYAGAAERITVPIESIVTLSTTFIAQLDRLDLLDALVGVDRRGYVYNREVRRRIDEGSVLEVGESNALDIERIIALNPDLVMISALSGDDPGVEQLRRAGVPLLIGGDWLETSPLGRAEWIRVMGALFGEEERAQATFEEVAADYEEYRRRLSKAEEKPTVLANAPYRGEWAVPAGDSYMARLFSDAGANYLWSETEGSGSIFLDLEEVFARASEADFWINLGFRWRNRQDILAVDNRLRGLGPFQSGRMYHYNRRVRRDGANDFWESGAVRPDRILADLGTIFHPDLLEEHELFYYRRIE